jgi:V8-like Glu-specific endopeptidase
MFRFVQAIFLVGILYYAIAIPVQLRREKMPPTTHLEGVLKGFRIPSKPKEEKPPSPSSVKNLDVPSKDEFFPKSTPTVKQDGDENGDKKDKEGNHFGWITLSKDGSSEKMPDLSFMEPFLKSGGERPMGNILSLPKAQPVKPKKRLTKREIFGRDDREYVFDHLPYSAIGYIKDCSCTGFLIAPNVVMTAAHCLYDSDAKEFYNRSLDFYRGRNCYYNNNYEGEKMYGREAYVPNSYRDYPWRENDYGFIILANYSKQYLGFMVKNITDSLPIRILSYSHDTGSCMTTTKCNASLFRHKWYYYNNENLFCYDCDTAYESSGAPILYSDEIVIEGQISIPSCWMVIGVNNGYFPDSYNGPCNVGARFTRERWFSIDDIKRNTSIIAN